jgi:hypothetical protein
MTPPALDLPCCADLCMLPEIDIKRPESAVVQFRLDGLPDGQARKSAYRRKHGWDFYISHLAMPLGSRPGTFRETPDL